MLGSGKWEGGSDVGNMALILTGIGMIVVALTCFKQVPFIGTVFLIPGESILKAEVADPVVRYALFLVGGVLTGFGIQQISNRFTRKDGPATAYQRRRR